MSMKMDNRTAATISDVDEASLLMLETIISIENANSRGLLSTDG